MVKFQCYNCGSSNLGYQKWISSCSPINNNDNGHIEYEQTVIDEENELDGADGFICMPCGHELHLYGHRIQTEDDLKSYLSLDPDKQKEEERLYKEGVEEEARIVDRMQEAEIEYLLSRADRYFNEE